MSSNNDVAQLITNQIIDALEKGTIPWRKSWKTELPMNLVTKHGYRGINLLLLCLSPYTSPHYLTFKQVSAIGGFIKRGEKGYRVVYWQLVDDKGPNTGQGDADTGHSPVDEPRKKPFLRYYTVFNVEQCSGVPERLIPKSMIRIEPITACENVVNNIPSKPKIIDAREAYYERITDTIGIPSINRFISREEHYSTLFHELVHSTGHPCRLNREYKQAIASNHDEHSKEELIAELGNAFLCAHAHISPKTIDNQASYIAHWLEKLKSDKRLIISASSSAQKAVDYILGKSDEKMPADLDVRIPENVPC